MDDCVQCNGEIVDPNILIQLDCEHFICIECASKLYEENSIFNCPACNSVIYLPKAHVYAIQFYQMQVNGVTGGAEGQTNVYHCDVHPDKPIEFFWISKKTFISQDVVEANADIDKENDLKPVTQEDIP